MKSAKRFGWVLLGALAGWSASASLGAEAQPEAGGRSLTAIRVVIPVGTGVPNAYFLQDGKTGACWLMIRSRDDRTGALAPAPPESCEQDAR